MESFTKNKWFVSLIYILLGAAVLFMVMRLQPLFGNVYRFLKAILMPFFIAMIISYVLHPIVNMLHRRRMPRTIAVLLIYVVFLASVTVILMNLIPMFMKQLEELNEHLPELTMKAQWIVDGVKDNRWLPDSVRGGLNKAVIQLENALSEAISGFVNRIGSTISLIFVAFITPFLAFYMLKDYQVIEKSVLAIVPKKHRHRTVRVLLDIDEALGHYIRGQFIVCIIIGVFAYIGYSIIGMPYPLLLASFVSLFNIIPYLGPFFGAAPALIMASTVSVKMMLYVVIVNTICQTLEGNVVSPQVVGKTLHLHPLLIIFALLVGGEIAGIVGLILAVPCLAIVKVIIHHLRIVYNHRTNIK